MIFGERLSVVMPETAEWFYIPAVSQGGGMVDDSSPVGKMPQCCKPSVWLGILTAAGVPAQSQGTAASSSSSCSPRLGEAEGSNVPREHPE